MSISYKSHFSKFIGQQKNRLHFAAHSHHFWPDVTLKAHEQCWLDAAEHVDDKWNHIFENVIPTAQKHIAQELSLPDVNSLVFAPNTHEFVTRILSCFSKPKIVTSDSEFHSFERQTRRLEESHLAQVIRVPAEPFESFEKRLAQASTDVDLVFVSHVFFNSGHAIDLNKLATLMPEKPMLVVDGYHGFCAVETDFSLLHKRLFYLAGGYKYAMAGEGACFLHVPANAPQRPINTGWFASFGNLQEKVSNEVVYAKNGARFFGATFDASGLYRLNASMKWRADTNVNTHSTRQRAHSLHEFFRAKLSGTILENIPFVETPRPGLFLTLRTQQAQYLCDELKKREISVDARGDRLRFGFGLYVDESDVDLLISRLKLE